MRLPEWLARINRYLTNPVQRLWAGRLPGFGIIEHTGRRSGRPYRTPVNVYAVPGGFAVMLMYGPERDWLRNLAASGSGKLVHRGRTYAVTNPSVVPASEALEFLGKGPAALLRRLHVDYVLRLTSG